MKQVLFVDDEQNVLSGMQRLIRKQHSQWQLSFALGGEQALALLDLVPIQVVVSDMRMPGMDGITLLENIRVAHPRIARIILTGYADLGAALRAASIAHQYLLKPCTGEMLSAAIERACCLQEIVSTKTVAATLGSLSELPCAADAHASLIRLMDGPAPSLEDIARIVESDVGLSAKVLQLSSSEFFGASKQTLSVRDAVIHLGVTVFRSLTSAAVFRAMDP